LKALFVLACLALAGCNALPQRPNDIQASYKATPTYNETLQARLNGQNPADSGVLLLVDARQALAARLAMIDTATVSIDVQYYIWAADAVGSLIIHRLIDAAKRGVRVRMLVDDTSVFGKDEPLMSLHAHPNIEIRAFNPFRFRMQGRPVRRVLDVVSGAKRLNRRMHNKVLAIDNAAAIVGGRNLADEYFGANPERSFRDIEVFTVGPVVDGVSKSFDDYWNSQWAYPLDTLSKVRRRGVTIDDVIERLKQNSADLASQLRLTDLRTFLDEHQENLRWCEVEVLVDPSTKLAAETRQASPVIQRLVELAQQSEHEILIENAYFIPGTLGVDALSRLPQRNVTVKVLTNSLASNDAGVSHAGYKNYRKALLAADIDLYELRADAALRSDFEFSAVQLAGLHSKATTFDRRIAFIGSFNLDPRSTFINTEIGLLIHDRGFTEELAQSMESSMQAENAWRLQLNNQGKLRWHSGKVERREPPASLSKRFTAWLLALLPLEGQL
jgi:putative cardiolipin synthase